MRLLGDERVRAVVVLAMVAFLVLQSPKWVLPGMMDEDEAALQAEVVHAEALRAGVRATIAVDGKQIVHRAPAATVGELLADAGVEVGPLDRVTPGLDEPVEDDLVIRVVRVTQEQYQVEAPIPYETWRWAEPRWEVGYVGLLRAGREGKELRTVLATYEDGRLVQQLIVDRQTLEPPRAEIIGIGTRIVVRTLETPAGVIRYTDVLEMEATAYYPGPESTGRWADGYTSTGMKAGHGVIAVDPSVIPLGTKVYIPGYGIAVAADVGGAIRGNLIDLAFDTYREAMHFGRQRVKVYILASD